MDVLKRLLRLLLNPRPQLDRLSSAGPMENDSGEGETPAGSRGRVALHDVVTNLPLMAGAVIVLALFFLVLFGPVLAPKNPYIAGQHMVPHYDFDQQEYVRPPLAPSAEYPLGTDRWGNDLLSLMMHGARNTLVACAFITMVRVLVGLGLGGLAGWNEGGIADQLIMGGVVVITSVPMLISSMVLIYALDIRRGLPVFIIALSLIGWAEIAQYIRGEFLVLRKMPYLEGARAAGLNGVMMVVRHLLPNVLPQLLVISFLEMGAVMMLLGELGFVGVFIGGGTQNIIRADFFESDVVTQMEIPEWGAILAEGFRLLRWKPFVVVPPAVAFFLSVLGFNALGEGLRRLIEKKSLNTAFLLRKRMVLAVVGLTLATVVIINNTGPAPWFARVAQAYQGSAAYEHVKVLASMGGRGAGSPDAEEAAAYIAERFQAYGLEPGWKQDQYVYPLETRLVEPLVQPALALVDEEGDFRLTFRHQIDFGFMTEGHGGSGDVTAPVTFVGFDGDLGRASWEVFKGLDLRGRIALVWQGNAPADFATEALIRGAQGVLWITGEGRDDIHSQRQLAGPTVNYLRSPTLPILRIRPEVGEAIAAEGGSALSELLIPDRGASQSGVGWFAKELGATVHISVALSEPVTVEVPCVLGYRFGSDFALSGELVVIFAAYDGLGTDPDGTVYPGANHGTSGIALLLELARLWQDQNLDTRRSVLFMAWGGGELDEPGVKSFLSDRRNIPRLSSEGMYGQFAPAALVELDYVGAGGDTLWIDPSSDSRLAGLFEAAAADTGVATSREVKDLPLPRDVVPSPRTRWLYFTWSDATIRPDEDTVAHIDPDRLEKAGRALTLTLTQVVREGSY
jgi:ABC-type dipeptide/oligopeptide/nickel transport system permease subunit